MKRILVAIAMLAIVPATFGAVELRLVDPADGDQTLGPVAGGGTFTVNLMLLTDGNPVTGVSYSLVTDAPGIIRLTDRTGIPEWLYVTDNSVALLPANNLLNPKNARDLGSGAADGVTPLPGDAVIQTLTLTASAPLGTLGDVHIWVAGPGVQEKATWADPDFNTPTIESGPSTLTITPEPASMLLLAAGAAFFARRRRA